MLNALNLPVHYKPSMQRVHGLMHMQDQKYKTKTEAGLRPVLL